MVDSYVSYDMIEGLVTSKVSLKSRTHAMMVGKPIMVGSGVT